MRLTLLVPANRIVPFPASAWSVVKKRISVKLPVEFTVIVGAGLLAPPRVRPFNISSLRLFAINRSASSKTLSNVPVPVSTR